MPGKNTCAIGYLFVTSGISNILWLLQQQFCVARDYSTLAQVNALC